MKHHKFGTGSEGHLIGIHPDLVAVFRRGLQLSPYDFGLTDGLRTYSEQQRMVEIGASTTLKSLHLKQHTGDSHAGDIVVYAYGVNLFKLYEAGKITEAQLQGYFRKVIQALITAAIELQVQVEFGGLWRTFLDMPHVQLNQKYYGSGQEGANA
jgi:peptidoglycan L-alanyl-D-glutamate endopeptidase CwlK